MRKYSFKGGVHPYEGKELAAEMPVRALEPGGELAFLLSQHIGAPAKPIVQKGDAVLVGTKVAEAGGFVSSPVFSSVSGTVKGIEKRKSASGALVDAVIVKNDRKYEAAAFEPLPGMEQYPADDFSGLDHGGRVERGHDLIAHDHWNAHPAKSALEEIRPDEKLSGMNKEQILARIKDAGIVGMGGAGFPTHVKLSPKDPDSIDYILVNGAECEPYITCDYRLLCDRPGELIAGLKAILSMFPKAAGVFCIEDNKPKAIEIMEEACKGEKNIRVAVCRTKYPEGAERSMIKAATGREVNSSMLPADAGCIVDNVSTIFAIFQAVYLGRPLYQRFFTFSGDAAAEPGNFLIPTGMSYQDLAEKCGGFTELPEKVISGGPMMGFAQGDLTAIVTKTTSAITSFIYDPVSRETETPCINCGRCVAACPAKLIPSHLATMVTMKQYDKFEENYGLECVNCGSCSWSCPAKRQLATLINEGRQTVLALKRARKGAKS